MSKRYLAVRPYDDQADEPGRRIVVSRQRGEGLVHIDDETVLPERVARTDARRRKANCWLILTTDEAAWLRDRLTEALS